MYTKYEHNGLVWIDMESPTRDEMRQMVAQYGIKPMIAEELLAPSTKPRAEFYENYAYFVMHFPAVRHSKTREQEIDFVVGHDFLITTRYATVDPLHKFAKIFEANSVLDETNVGNHAGFLLFYMLKRLYKAVEHELDHVRHDLARTEERVFHGQEKEMVAVISRSARDLLNLRQTIEPHRETLHALENEGIKFFGADFAPFLRGLSNEYYRVHNHIMRETESLHELRETNNSLLTTKQNETMKIFTVMAFFTFPLSLVVSVLSIHTQDNPLYGISYGFWLLVIALFALAAGMYWFFKRKDWI